MEDAKTTLSDYSGMVAEIVSAYVSNNSVPVTDLPALIASVNKSLHGTSAPIEPPKVELVPAVTVKKSVTPDFIICLEDGKKFRSLKRHLTASFGMTPDEYRTKWGLPGDYPMVAPAYATMRSALAKKIGLGQQSKGRAAANATPTATAKKSPAKPAKAAKKKAA